MCDLTLTKTILYFFSNLFVIRLRVGMREYDVSMLFISYLKLCRFTLSNILENSFKVKAVIEQCAATMEGHVRLSCDMDKVIYSPAFSLSGYTRRNSKCIFGKKYPCGGFSPRLLVQRNECYWKQSCDITWEKSTRIVVSKEPRCIGYSASTLGLSGHRCVNKGK